MGRYALLVGTGHHDDPALRPLKSPEWDVKALSDVLADPEVGQFEVTRLMDRSVQELRVAVEDFLVDRTAGDFVLVYLSCHGVLDKRGRLAFAATDTVSTRLGATALSAVWLHELLADCVAASRVLVLDCCFSGAHDRAKAGADAVAAQLAEVGSGHAVLTASRDWEFSFEGDRSGGSVFTTGLVEGLRTGAADLDRDGLISVEEAYAFTADHVRDQGAAQHPQRWLTAAEGRLVLARSPFGPQPVPHSAPPRSSEARRLDLERRSALAASQAQVLRSRDPALAQAVALAAIRDLAPSRAALLTLWGMAVEPRADRFPVGHGGPVVEMAWSGDSSSLTSIGREGTACEWDASGALLASTPIPVEFREARMSRNARSLLLDEVDGAVSLWQVRGMRHVARSRTMRHFAAAFRWSNDGERLFDGDAGAEAVIWSVGVTTEDEPAMSRRSIPAPRESTPHWSPDDRLLAFLDEHGVVVVHADSGDVVAEIRTPGKPSGLTWHPDGSKVCLLTPVGPQQMMFVPAERHHVTIYDLTGRLLAEREATGVVCLEWAPSGDRIGVMSAGAASEAEVHVWDAETLTDVAVLATGWPGAPLMLNAVLRWSHDSRRLAFAHWTSVVIWDHEHGVDHRSHSGALEAFGWAPDKSRAAISTLDRRALTVIHRDRGVIAGMADDRLIGHAISWSPDGRQVAMSSRGGVLVWSPSDGEPAAVLAGLPDMVLHVVWSPDGRFLAVAAHAFLENRPNRVVVRAVEGRRDVVEMTGDGAQHGPLAWSPDGTRLLGSGGPGEVVIWLVATGHREQTFGSSGSVTAVCWPPALPHLVAVADEEHKIRVLDRRAGREVAVGIGHSAWIKHLTWSPDGTYLASSSRDGTVRLWDGMTGSCLVELDAPSGALSLVWSDDASRLILVSRDSSVITWTLPEHLDDVIGSVDEGRVMTDEERVRYGLVT